MRLIDADALRANLPRVDMDLHIMDIKRRIDRAPTVDAVPVVRGEWIEPDENDITTACICSLCDWRGYIMEDDVRGMPYCPNCGAKMESEDKT